MASNHERTRGEKKRRKRRKLFVFFLAVLNVRRIGSKPIVFQTRRQREDEWEKGKKSGLGEAARDEQGKKTSH